MRTSCIAIVAAAACSSACFAQGLMGTTLDFSYRFTSIGDVFDGPHSTTITGAVEQSYGYVIGGVTIDVTDSQMIYTFLGSNTMSPAAYNGPLYTDTLNNLGAITSVTIDASTTLAGAVAGRIYWDADNFGYNFEGMSYNAGDRLVLNIVAPTPGAAAMLGLAGVASLRRRRK